MWKGCALKATVPMTTLQTHLKAERAPGGPSSLLEGSAVVQCVCVTKHRAAVQGRKCADDQAEVINDKPPRLVR